METANYKHALGWGAAALASTTLFLLAMPPGYVALGAFIAWVPMFAVFSTARSAKAVAALWFAVACVLAFVLSYPLIRYPIAAFGQPFALAFSLIAINSLWTAIPYALAAWISHKLTARWSRAGHIATPFIFATCVTQFPVVFPAGLYLSLYQFPWAYGWAEFGGSWILSLWLFAFNWLIAQLVLSLWQKGQTPKGVIPTAIVLVITFVGVGHWRQGVWEDREQAAITAGRVVKVALIQPALPPENAAKVDLPFPENYTREDLLLIPLSTEALQQHPDIDLIVWPEFPLRIDYLTQPQPRSLINQWRSQNQAALLFCSLENVDPATDSTASIAHFLYPSAASSEMRSKKRLIPMSEVLPGESFLPFMRDLFPQVNNLTKDENFQPIELRKGVQIAPLICYDDMFPSVARRWVAEGADILVSMTNDSWFGDNRMQDMRLAAGMLNVMETRKPWVRVGNANNTLIIYPSGEAFDKELVRDYRRGWMVGQVPLL
ncbi:apolipoprotein N-acyltransferase [Cerasicoccus maritimus]|uniref:apolipoprotein N-acyltransferase n=1 Tax=Cerasicoccus maritimus TaxID=490089 RepID=UPI0028524E94|nr:apolipoprotein N-acyltransferase [Cerasicoccus maritimus]